MTLTTEQLAALEAAFEKATKGEWYAFNKGRPPTIALMLKSTMKEIILWTGFDGSHFQRDNAANVKFIALAHNLMPALIAAVKEAERLRAERDDWKAQFEHEAKNSKSFNSALAKANALLDEAVAAHDAALTAGRKGALEEAYHAAEFWGGCGDALAAIQRLIGGEKIDGNV